MKAGNDWGLGLDSPLHWPLCGHVIAQVRSRSRHSLEILLDNNHGFAYYSPSPMDVPADLLVPPEAYGRSFSPHDAALVLDDWLRRLAAHEARCRTVLGTLARRFLARRGHHELWFARLGDYARERLGISARELQSLASVSARLERLPRLREAFAEGALGWAQLRLLAVVATPETEAEWLEVARGRTARALAAVIRPSGEDDEGDDTRFRLRCPRRVRLLWQHVVELARRMAGSEVTHGKAAEAIAAEGLSARSACGDAWPTLDPAAPEPPDPSETRAAFADLDWSAVRAAVPEDIARLALHLDGLDPFAVDARMRDVLRAMRRIDWQLGRLLRVFLDRRLHRLMLFPSAARYLTERLGISARKARALVALERKTWEAEAFGTAYRAGDLSWVRAFTILPVVTETTAQAWVARATAVPVRRLADEVEWAMTVRDGVTSIAPPLPGASLDIGERQMCARPEWEVADAAIAFSAPASVVALLRTAILAFAEPHDSLVGGLESLLCHVKAEWEGQPRHPDPVFARDGWRCAVPVCTARRNLHDHHLVFRSRGGGNGRENRLTLCVWHHLRGVHAGRIRAEGEAPDAVSWEIGVRTGRRPLLRLIGERYAGHPAREAPHCGRPAAADIAFVGR